MFLGCSNNFHDLYINILNEHLNRFEYINSPRNQAQQEKLFSSFSLSNPIERVCYAVERKTNLTFQFAEVLWYLSGSNSLDFISYYAPRIAQYSMDGKSLLGTAYGNKIFHYNGLVNQWKYVVEELRRDSDSKRAVITIRSPEEVLVKNNIDMSCTLSLQFLARNNKLHMITTMRANDVFVGELSDVFSFTFMQELLANELGIEVGEYHHQVGSTHLYSWNISKAANILKHRKNYESYSLSFPKMPTGNNWGYIRNVLNIEKNLRSGQRLCEINPSLLDMPSYWTDIVFLFELYRRKRMDEKIDVKSLEILNPTIRYFANSQYLI